MTYRAKKLYLLPAGRCLVDASALDTRLEPGRLANLPMVLPGRNDGRAHPSGHGNARILRD